MVNEDTLNLDTNSDVLDIKSDYTDLQFARYVSKTLYFKIRDLEYALREMENGKFFKSRDCLIGARDSLRNLKIQTDSRLNVLESINSKTNTSIQ